jgi:hypothetical protein
VSRLRRDVMRLHPRGSFHRSSSDVEGGNLMDLQEEVLNDREDEVKDVEL